MVVHGSNDDARKKPDQALLHHLAYWQKCMKKHAKHLDRIGHSTKIIDAEMLVLVDVINQINAIRVVRKRMVDRMKR